MATLIVTCSTGSAARRGRWRGLDYRHSLLVRDDLFHDDNWRLRRRRNLQACKTGVMKAANRGTPFVTLHDSQDVRV